MKTTDVRKCKRTFISPFPVKLVGVVFEFLPGMTDPKKLWSLPTYVKIYLVRIYISETLFFFPLKFMHHVNLVASPRYLPILRNPVLFSTLSFFSSLFFSSSFFGPA